MKNDDNQRPSFIAIFFFLNQSRIRNQIAESQHHPILFVGIFFYIFKFTSALLKKVNMKKSEWFILGTSLVCFDRINGWTWFIYITWSYKAKIAMFLIENARSFFPNTLCIKLKGRRRRLLKLPAHKDKAFQMKAKSNW
jgi:hypothetical protein